MKNKHWKFNWWNFITIVLSLSAVGISMRSCDETKKANLISERSLKLQLDQHKKLIKPELQVSVHASKYTTTFNGYRNIPRDSSYHYKIENVGTGKATLKSFKLEWDSVALRIGVNQNLPLNIQPGKNLMIFGSLKKQCNINCNAKTRYAMESIITIIYSDEIGTVYKLSLGASHTISGVVTTFNGFNKNERELADTLDAYAMWY